MDNPGAKKLIACRGLKQVECKAEHSKQSALCFARNALGKYLPLIVVYKM